jgi:hypothetical protein
MLYPKVMRIYKVAIASLNFKEFEKFPLLYSLANFKIKLGLNLRAGRTLQ